MINAEVFIQWPEDTMASQNIEKLKITDWDTFAELTKKFEEDLAKEQAAADNFKKRLSQERTATNKLKEDLAQERTETNTLKEDLAQERTATDKLIQDLAQERTATNKLKEDLAQERTATNKLKQDLAQLKSDLSTKLALSDELAEARIAVVRANLKLQLVQNKAELQAEQAKGAALAAELAMIKADTVQTEYKSARENLLPLELAMEFTKI